MYSTASNCPAPAQCPQPNDVGEADMENENTAPTTTADKGTKRKTKSQSERDTNIEKILAVAQVDDHPVELALSAIAKQMIRKLDTDEQDELLDEIQSVSSKYFQERHKRIKSNNHQSVVSVVPTHPPPPLTPAGPANTACRSGAAPG